LGERPEDKEQEKAREGEVGKNVSMIEFLRSGDSPDGDSAGNHSEMCTPSPRSPLLNTVSAFFGDSARGGGDFKPPFLRKKGTGDKEREGERVTGYSNLASSCPSVQRTLAARADKETGRSKKGASKDDTNIRTCARGQKLMARTDSTIEEFLRVRKGTLGADGQLPKYISSPVAQTCKGEENEILKSMHLAGENPLVGSDSDDGGDDEDDDNEEDFIVKCSECGRYVKISRVSRHTCVPLIIGGPT
tara:strand:- start:505 stop:1245 length:741 start_codon:yes stop_codon:yes gene_type:complete